MNRTQMACLLALAAAAPSLNSPNAAAQQTAFTYQGVLESGGSPVNGNVNVIVRLFGVASGGSEIDSDVIGVVSVSDGLLSIQPDFGPDAFTGSARWIEFEVDGQVLSPRQLVQPTPYALHALSSASSAQWASSGSAITNQNTGFVGINRDYTVGLEWFGVHAPVNSGYGGMYVTTEGDTAWPFYGFKAGNQSAWTYLDGGDGDWHVNVDGNKLTVTDEGMVGIRTTSPAYPLHVVSTNTDRTIHGENSTSTGVGVRGAVTHATGANVGVHGSSVSTTGFGVLGETLAASGGSVAVRGHVNSSTAYATYMTGPAGSRNYFERSVGIGTDLPLYPLHVVNASDSANTRAIHGLSTHTGTSASVHGVVGEYRGTSITSTTGAGVWGYHNAISGAGGGVRGETNSTAGRGVVAIANATTGNNYGLVAQSNSPDSRTVYTRNNSTTGNAFAFYAITDSPTGYSGYFGGAEGSRTYFEHKVGIGTLSPANPLSVAGGADITGQVSIGITGADARLLVRGVLGEDAFRVRVEGSTKLLVKDNGGVGIGSNFTTLPANGLRTAGVVGIGADPGAFTLAVNGDAAKPGGGSWSVFSDARLKYDVQPLEAGSLDRLLSLHGYRFRYDDTAIENRLALPGVQTGLIAQEVQQVFPDWVSEDDEGYLYITERGLTAIMVEAMRELRQEKDAQIADLQRQIDEMRKLIPTQQGTR